MTGLSFTHVSNGRDGATVAQLESRHRPDRPRPAGLERSCVRPWLRLHEDAVVRRQPGHRGLHGPRRLLVTRNWQGHEISAMLRHSLRGGERGARRGRAQLGVPDPRRAQGISAVLQRIWREPHRLQPHARTTSAWAFRSSSGTRIRRRLRGTRRASRPLSARRANASHRPALVRYARAVIAATLAGRDVKPALRVQIAGPGPHRCISVARFCFCRTVAERMRWRFISVARRRDPGRPTSSPPRDSARRGSKGR